MKKVFSLFFIILLLFTVFVLPVNAALYSPAYTYNAVIIKPSVVSVPIVPLGYSSYSSQSDALFSWGSYYIHRINVNSPNTSYGVAYDYVYYIDGTRSEYSNRTSHLSFLVNNSLTTNGTDLSIYPVFDFSVNKYIARIGDVESQLDPETGDYIDVEVDKVVNVYSTHDGESSLVLYCLQGFYDSANSLDATTSNNRNGYELNRFAWQNDYRTYGTETIITPDAYVLDSVMSYSDMLNFVNTASLPQEDTYNRYYFNTNAITRVDGVDRQLDGVYIQFLTAEEGYRFYYRFVGDTYPTQVYTSSDGWFNNGYRLIYFVDTMTTVDTLFVDTFGTFIGSGEDAVDSYSAGFNNGYAAGSSASFGQNLIGDTLSAPFKALNTFILFEYNGVAVTLGGVFGAMLALILFIIFLKMFAGG